MQVPAIVKKHPIATVGVVIGGVLLLALVMNAQGGGGGTTTVNTGPTDAQVAASTQLQLAQLSVSAQSAQSAAQIAADQAKYGAEFNLAKYQGDQQFALQDKSLDLTAAYQKLQTETQAALAQQTFAYQLASQQSAESASYNTLKLQTDANMHAADTQATTTLGLAAIGADTQKTLTNYAAQISQAQIASSTTIAKAQTDAAVSIAKSNNKSKNLGNILGTVGSLAMAFF